MFKKILVFLLIFHVSAFALKSQQSVKMGESVVIKTKAFQPFITGRVLGGKIVKGVNTSAPMRIPQRFSPTSYVSVDLEITNVGSRSEDIDFDDFILIASNGPVSSIVGSAMQVTLKVGGSETIQSAKDEIILEPKGTVHCSIIFGTSSQINSSSSLVFAFDDDGYPRSTLKLS
jgi:hypothetical protein